MKTNEIMLVKKCPDGAHLSIKFTNEAELREHLDAMWKYTTGYSIVAVYLLPAEHRG